MDKQTGIIKNSPNEGEVIDVPIIHRSVKKYNRHGIEVELEWFPKKIECPDCGEKFDKYDFKKHRYTLRHRHGIDLERGNVVGPDCWTRVEIPYDGEVA